MKKITYALLSLVLLFSSCEDEYDNREDVILNIIGIYAENINVLSGEQVFFNLEDLNKKNLLTTEDIDASNFVIDIAIGEKLDGKYIEEAEAASLIYPGIYTEENSFSYGLMSHLLRKETSREYHISEALYTDLLDDYTTPSPITRTNMVRLELCITGVKDFVITADKTIFGVQPGGNLAYYFAIESYYPDQVINYQDQKLLLGMSSQEKLTSISQWLSLHPLAFRGMELKFRTIPTELPLDVTFTVALLRDDDVWIKGTTSAKIK